MFIVLLFIVGAAANQCDLVEPELQYWVNTATTARDITGIVARGDFLLNSLTVTGKTSLEDTEVKTLTFDQLVQTETGESSTFAGEVTFNGGIEVTGNATFEANDQNNLGLVTFTNVNIQFGDVNLTQLLATVKDLRQKISELQQNITTMNCTTQARI
tara:strand:- start:288 stop:761 length:474 start_codon:yes stop_codon:yes gene_type:complete